MSDADVPSTPDKVDRRRVWLGILIVSWGIQAIVTQSLLLREALVLTFGSEFAWGVVLFAWLLGVAVGAAVGGRVAERLRRALPALAHSLIRFAFGLRAALAPPSRRGSTGLPPR